MAQPAETERPRQQGKDFYSFAAWQIQELIQREFEDHFLRDGKFGYDHSTTSMKTHPVYEAVGNGSKMGMSEVDPILKRLLLSESSSRVQVAMERSGHIVLRNPDLDTGVEIRRHLEEKSSEGFVGIIGDPNNEHVTRAQALVSRQNWIETPNPIGFMENVKLSRGLMHYASVLQSNARLIRL